MSEHIPKSCIALDFMSKIKDKIHQTILMNNFDEDIYLSVVKEFDNKILYKTFDRTIKSIYYCFEDFSVAILTPTGFGVADPEMVFHGYVDSTKVVMTKQNSPDIKAIQKEIADKIRKFQKRN